MSLTLVFSFCTTQELARCKLSQSKLLLSFVMSAENWQDVEEKQVARALHRLSKFFAIPKVSEIRNGR